MFRFAIFFLCFLSWAFASKAQTLKPGHLRSELGHPALPGPELSKPKAGPMNLLDPKISIPANPDVDPKITIKELTLDIDPRMIIPYPPEPSQKRWKKPLKLTLPDSLSIRIFDPDKKN